MASDGEQPGAVDRQKRILSRVHLLGGSVEAFVRDVFKIVEEEPAYATMTNLVGHCLREVSGNLRVILLPDEAAGDMSHRESILAVLGHLELAHEETTVASWLRLEGKGGGDQKGLHAYAHRRGALAPRLPDSEFWGRWNDAIVVLDRVFEAVEARYSVWVRRARAIAHTSPPNINALIQEVPQSNVVLAEFFKEATDPRWLPLLRGKGYFDSPSQPWPQAGFLERMAANEPVLVHEILMGLDTDDHWLRGWIADAALQLPAELLESWAVSQITWLLSQPSYGALLPDRFAKMVPILSAAGHTASALRLFDVLTAFADPEDGEHERRGFREPHMRFEDYYFGTLTKRCLPALVESEPLGTLDLLIGKLEEALAKGRYSGEHGPPEDHSHVWLRGDLVAAQHDDIKQQLVAAVAQVSLDALGGQRVTWDAVLERLAACQWNVFRRIELRTLLEGPSPPLEVIACHLGDETLFDMKDVRREYHLLAAKHLKDVPADVLDGILAWIEAGPDMSWMREDPWPDDVVARHKDEWRLRHLWPLRDSLPPDWNTRVAEFQAQLGEPDDALDASGIREWSGPESPTSQEDLDAMTVDQIIQQLREWVPPEGWGVPDREGLSRTLWKTVERDPARFAGQLDAFRDVHPQYGNGLLHGLEEGLQAKRYFEWAPVLDFCAWVVSQGPDPDPSARHIEHWGASRQQVVHLIARGLDTDASGFPGADPRVVEMLAQLTDDPDPTPEREAKRLENTTPFTLALNSIRGRTLQAVMRWLAWRDRQVAREGGVRPPLDEPSIKLLLERHLQPSVDPSAAVRSAYGQGLPVLHLVDPEWLTTELPAILPADDAERPYWHAAWEAYVCFCPVYNNLASLLLPHYQLAVERLDRESEERDSYVDQLASHLAVMYWREIIGREDDGILATFFATAPKSARAHFWWFVGRSVGGWTEEVPPHVFQRLMDLWDWRVVSESITPKELKSFGWVFHSKKFPLAWALDRLRNVGAQVGPTDADMFVLEYLQELAPDHPQEVVACLHAMLEAIDYAPGIRWLRDSLIKTFQICQGAGNDDTRSRVATIANRMVAHHHLEYEALLPSPTADPAATPGD